MFIITFNLKDYKNKYESLKNEFLNINKDFDEINFIENEIENYNNCLLILNSNKLLAFSVYTNPEVAHCPHAALAVFPARIRDTFTPHSPAEELLTVWDSLPIWTRFLSFRSLS